MNVYDEAHSLAKAIKESGEFKEFDRMRKEIEQDAEVSKMLGEFQKLQIELQTAQMTGSQPSADTIQRMQSLGTMLATKPLAARFMQTEAAFSVMMNDVFKIIGEAVGLQ
ncbi:MAG: YlbF family regulator [Mogibacterium sp.]|nr:YlbF family regulator [Mogibacterium sp.]